VCSPTGKRHPSPPLATLKPVECVRFTHAESPADADPKGVLPLQRHRSRRSTTLPRTCVGGGRRAHCVSSYATVHRPGDVRGLRCLDVGWLSRGWVPFAVI